LGPDVPGYRPAVRRLTRFAVTLILAASLLYMASDAVPPAWIHRLADVTGLGDIVASIPGFRTDAPGGDEEALSSAAPVVAGDDIGAGGKPLAGSRPEDSGEDVVSSAPSGAPLEFPAPPAPDFVIHFSPDSDSLETDGWNALDSAALLLREQPDRIALITDAGHGTETRHSEPELAGARIASVQQYLLAAGIDRQRLRVGRQAAPDARQPPGDPGAGDAVGDEQFVYISVSDSPSP
jgi:hypothetical protein